MRDAGLAYAIDQIVDLIANGVDGIHLYTMNNMENTRHIWNAIKNLLPDQTVSQSQCTFVEKERVRG